MLFRYFFKKFKNDFSQKRTSIKTFFKLVFFTKILSFCFFISDFILELWAQFNPSLIFFKKNQNFVEAVEVVNERQDVNEGRRQRRQQHPDQPDNQEPESLHLVPNPDNKSFFSLGHGWLVRQEGKNGKIEEIQCQKVQLTKLTASELVDPHDIAGCITLPP